MFSLEGPGDVEHSSIMLGAQGESSVKVPLFPKVKIELSKWRLGSNERKKKFVWGVETTAWRRQPRSYKVVTGVGRDGFHSTVPLDLSKETRGKVVMREERWCGSLRRWSNVGGARNKLAH